MSANNYLGHMTYEQGRWIAAHAEEIKVLSIGLGTNGHPAGRDAWVVFVNDDHSYWLTPEGTTRQAS